MKIAYYIINGVGFDYSGIWKVEVLETKFVGPPAPRLKRGIMSRVRKLELVWWATDQNKPTPRKQEPETFTIRDSALAHDLAELQDKFDKMKEHHIRGTSQALTVMAQNHAHYLQKLAIYSRGMASEGAQLQKMVNTKLDFSNYSW